MGSFQYELPSISDEVGHHRSLSFLVSLSEEELDVLLRNTDRPRAAAILKRLCVEVMPRVLEAEDWACVSCGSRATRMVGTPAFYPDRPDGSGPSIVDMCPVVICAASACEQLAHRETRKILKSVERQLMVEEPTRPRLRSAQQIQCGNPQCESPNRFTEPGGKMSRCARCKAVPYCSKECQAAHWRAEHKAVCVPALP